MKSSALLTALFPAEPLPTVSLESVEADGVTRIEKEIEIYGTMRNMDDLDKASDWEIQEQWGLYVPLTEKNAGSGNTRVRLTQKKSGETSYVLTTKVKREKGNAECEEVSSADMFNLFKLLGDSGLRKKRYIFPIENSEMCFEVDVFFGPSGTMIPHVKIDLEICGEIPDDFDYNNVKLPFEMTDIRIIAPGRKNDEDLAYVRKLFSEQYDIPNQYKGDTVSLEEFAPSSCECGKCGWGSGPCPDKEERLRKEQIADDKASRENLVAHQKALCDLSNKATGLAQALSYNETKVEGRIKSQCHELAMSISAGNKLLADDAGDHEYR